MGCDFGESRMLSRVCHLQNAKQGLQLFALPSLEWTIWLSSVNKGVAIKTQLGEGSEKMCRECPSLCS